MSFLLPSVQDSNSFCIFSRSSFGISLSFSSSFKVLLFSFHPMVSASLREEPYAVLSPYKNLSLHSLEELRTWDRHNTPVLYQSPYQTVYLSHLLQSCERTKYVGGYSLPLPLHNTGYCCRCYYYSFYLRMYSVMQLSPLAFLLLLLLLLLLLPSFFLLQLVQN